MSKDHLLTRLAKTANPSQKKALKSHIFARIEGAPLQRLAQQITPEERQDMRDQILSRITRPQTSRSLADVSEVFAPSWERMQVLREEVLDRIASWQPAPSWQRYLKPVAITAVLTILIRVTPTLFIATPLQAESQNLLMPTAGTVSVTDGAEWSAITENLVLDHPMTLRTGPESTATIVLRDDAVLRLAENTEVTLRDSAFDSSIEGPIARVSYGQLWLTSLLPEALFAGTSIVLPQGTLALKDGSVSVLADPQQSSVQVFHKFARVLPTEAETIHLVQGDQLALLPNGETQRHLITDSLRESDWAKTNLARDAVHRTHIAERKQEHAKSVAGILPTSTFYTLKRASEQLDLLLTLSSESRKEKHLQHAQTRLHEAVALLKAGKNAEAESPLAEYRQAILEFATLSPEEAQTLLQTSLVESTTTVSAALPHSELYPAKKAVIEVATEVASAEIPQAEVDLYLLSDALLGIESLVAQGELTRATIALNGIEGAVASVLEHQELDGIQVAKNELKIMNTILRSIAFTLDQAEELIKAEQKTELVALQERIATLSPTPKPTQVASTIEEPRICMTVRERMRRTNQFLAAVYTYDTPVGQRNAVLQQIASLPDCAESAQILAKVMNKVPVFARSHVWLALQKFDAEI